MITDSPHDDFAQYQEERSLEKQLQKEETLAFLDDFAFENQIELVTFTPWHVRLINGAGKRIDVFPVNKRYHDVTGQKRGSYKNLLELLNTYFNIK